LLGNYQSIYSKLGKILGIVSVGDVVSHIIEQYRDENKHLRDYVRGYIEEVMKVAC